MSKTGFSIAGKLMVALRQSNSRKHQQMWRDIKAEQMEKRAGKQQQ